jgi:hypothetical protein
MRSNRMDVECSRQTKWSDGEVGLSDLKMKGLENVGSDTHTTFPKGKCQRHIQLLNMHGLPASHIPKVLPLRWCHMVLGRHDLIKHTSDHPSTSTTRIASMSHNRSTMSLQVIRDSYCHLLYLGYWVYQSLPCQLTLRKNHWEPLQRDRGYLRRTKGCFFNNFCFKSGLFG